MKFKETVTSLESSTENITEIGTEKVNILETSRKMVLMIPMPIRGMCLYYLEFFSYSFMHANYCHDQDSGIPTGSLK